MLLLVTARSSSVQVDSIIPGVESFVETAEEPGDKDGSTGDDDMMSGDDVGNHEHHKEGNGASDNVTDMDFSRGSNASGSQRADFPPATFESMANHILDKVTGQLFDELVDKVLAEYDVPLAVVTPEAFVTPATSALVMAEVGVAEDTGRCTAGDAAGAPVSRVAVSVEHVTAGSLSVTSGVTQLPGAGSACLAPKKKAAPVLRSPAVSSPDAAATPSQHSSKRRAGWLDEHSVERAERLVAERNLETPKGTKSLSSFLSLSDDHIAANVSKLGVLLGDNDSLVRHAVRQIKVFEHGSLAISQFGKNKIKRDLSKDLDEIEACVMMVLKTSCYII